MNTYITEKMAQVGCGKHETYSHYLWRRFGAQATVILATLTLCLMAGLAG